MIDITTEEVVSLSEAAKLKCLPRRRKGKRPHVATLYRWAQRGFNGVTLETLQVGGTLCTSIEALQRFFDRLSESDAPPTQPKHQRQMEIDRAESELEAAGI